MRLKRKIKTEITKKEVEYYRNNIPVLDNPKHYRQL